MIQYLFSVSHLRVWCVALSHAVEGWSALFSLVFLTHCISLRDPVSHLPKIRGHRPKLSHGEREGEGETWSVPLEKSSAFHTSLTVFTWSDPGSFPRSVSLSQREMTNRMCTRHSERQSPQMNLRLNRERITWSLNTQPRWGAEFVYLVSMSRPCLSWVLFITTQKSKGNHYVWLQLCSV